MIALSAIWVQAFVEKFSGIFFRESETVVATI